jgi:hypothetical protein
MSRESDGSMKRATEFSDGRMVYKNWPSSVMDNALGSELVVCELEIVPAMGSTTVMVVGLAPATLGTET